MSLGNPFANFARLNGGRSGANFGSVSSSTNIGGLASLQVPGAQQSAADRTSASGPVQGINQIELPSWLQADGGGSIGELEEQYGNIESNFDPTGQVEARNAAIGYNTSAGGQAANNAATEFSNRAAQSGASQLGAGVVKAQSMMPVLAQNAALKTDAADVAAKAHREGAGLAAQIASTIGELRQSYLSTLTGYAQGQQSLQLDKYRAEQDVASQAAQRQLGYAGLQADTYKANLLAKNQRDSEARLAATTILNSEGQGGSYMTDNSGRVTGGHETYNKLKAWDKSRTAAQNALGGMF